MDPRVLKLKTPDECDEFEKNANKLGKFDLAIEARKRAVELRALQYGAVSDAERECLEAIYAYEKVSSAEKGHKSPAVRTWQMIKRRGILPAVEHVVARKQETMGFKALFDMGLGNYAFEAVVLRYPHLFSSEAVQRSRDRLSEWNVDRSNEKDRRI